MALSQSVTDSLQEAERSLRNALAFAARGERSIVAKQIAEMIHSIEMMQMHDNLLDTLEELKEGKNG
jgi:hypothetical protein